MSGIFRAFSQGDDPSGGNSARRWISAIDAPFNGPFSG